MRDSVGDLLGIGYRTVGKDFPDRDAALLWIIDNQKGRRNVANIDRIALAAKRESIVARKAKANLKTSSGGSHPRPLAKLPKAEKTNTRRESAKAAGVGERTYDFFSRAAVSGTSGAAIAWMSSSVHSPISGGIAHFPFAGPFGRPGFRFFTLAKSAGRMRYWTPIFLAGRRPARIRASTRPGVTFNFSAALALVSSLSISRTITTKR
jgi:hypothetical protein